MAKRSEKTEKPEKLEKTEAPEPLNLLELVVALDRQHRRLRWTVVGLTLVTLVALAGAGAALLAPYNAQLGLYLRRWLGRPETIAVEKRILEAEKFALRTPDGKVRASRSSTTAWCAPASASAPAARSSTSTATTVRTTRRSAWRPTARPVSSSTARTASSAPRSAWLRTTPRASRSSTRAGATAPR